jgi:hypothetical protein
MRRRTFLKAAIGADGGCGMMQNPATAKVVTDLVLKRAPRTPIDSVAPSRLVE